MGKLYTKTELIREFKGKFIEECPHYDYFTRRTKFEVRSVKDEIWENHNPPEVIVSWYG